MSALNSPNEAVQSLSAQDTEQRSAQRVALLIRSAKVICEHGEFLCIIRDVSQTGVKLRLFHPLPESAGFDLCLANGDRFAIQPVWEQDGLAGFRFDGAVDLERILVEHCPYPKRPVRLKLNTNAAITTSSGQSCTATILDISREGMRVECNHPLAIAQKLRLWAEGLPDVDAIVRWRKSPVYGLVLPLVMSFDELAITAARMQLQPEAARSILPDAGASRFA